jgi:hypothetical protein
VGVLFLNAAVQPGRFGDAVDQYGFNGRFGGREEKHDDARSWGLGAKGCELGDGRSWEPRAGGRERGLDKQGWLRAWGRGQCGAASAGLRAWGSR